MRLICRYVCVDDPVPEGWTLHKLYGHHGANGYGVITMADNREKDDFYPTPPEATKAMMARCPWLKFPEGERVCHMGASVWRRSYVRSF